MDNNTPTIILSGGGTGGHVFPARALAEELKSRGYNIVLATDTRGLKYFDGLNATMPRHIIASGTYTNGIIGKVIGGLGLVKGLIQSIKLVRQVKPIAIVGFGGYPSAPPLFAGQLLGVRTILHEQNAILGLANKLLAPKASSIALSYEHTVGLSDKLKAKSVFTGNPVRQAIADLSIVPYPPMNDKITIMIVGGSQGAKVFSEIVPRAILALSPILQSRLHIIQQSRPDAVDAVREIYSRTETDFEIQSFFDDMPARIKATHLFITRSGASSVAEMTAAGRPAIYVPFPWNRDNQQVFNAEQVEKAGGGWMILEKNLTVEGLKQTLQNLLESPEILKKAALAAKNQGRIDAAHRLADIVAEFH
jgi:UDP-N-acetylglucosamine--N-acetylmuramyl-(pentapeptide) pyrophosphoryl-undecaprenol N-acetylglucosamine transferase